MTVIFSARLLIPVQMSRSLLHTFQALLGILTICSKSCLSFKYCPSLMERRRNFSRVGVQDIPQAVFVCVCVCVCGGGGGEGVTTQNLLQKPNHENMSV